MTSAESDSTSKAVERPPRSRIMLVCGAVIVAMAAAGSQWLRHKAASVDTTWVANPDRIGKNAPYIKTVDAVTQKMVEMAELTPDDVVYDLGCGDGRLVIAASLSSGCRGIGFDIDPERVAEARENVKQHGLEELVEIRQQDIFTVDLSKADVILMYLLPWMNRKLIPQFQEMDPGSRIISHDFALGQEVDYIKPNETAKIRVEERNETDLVHKWITPLKVPAKKAKSN